MPPMRSCSPSTGLGTTYLAAQARQHNPDLLLGRKLPAGSAADRLHNLLCRLLTRSGFLSHLRSFNGDDEPEILPSSTHPICLIGADAGPARIGISPCNDGRLMFYRLEFRAI